MIATTVSTDHLCVQALLKLASSAPNQLGSAWREECGQLKNRIELTIKPDSLLVHIPSELASIAPFLISGIWREEWANKSDIIVELTEDAKAFAEAAKLDPSILVYW